MHRLVLFANSRSPEAAILLEKTFQVLASREDICVAAVCLPVSYSTRSDFAYFLRRKTTLGIRGLFDAAHRHRHVLPRPVNLGYWSRRLGCRLIVPPKGTVNDPAFVEQLRTEVRPNAAIAYYWLQKFSPDILRLFNHTLNYHNGLLPHYKGRRATAWSVYCGEAETGYTFHRMNEKLDEGPILHQEAMPISPEESVSDLELEKAHRAARQIPHVLNLLLTGDVGRPQLGEGSYYSHKDFLRIRRIDDPSALSTQELLCRLRAFELLEMRIDGQWFAVTRLEQLPGPPKRSVRFSFQTADGSYVRVTRFRYLPAASWFRRPAISSP